MIGYKKCIYLDSDDYGQYASFKNALVTLEIPEDSEVVNPCMAWWAYAAGELCRYRYSKKHRCSYAKVLDIVDMDNQEKHVDCAFSIYDIKKRFNYGYNKQPITTYIKGHKVVADSLDEDEFTECSNGIHFFLTKEDAIEYTIQEDKL